MIEISLLNAVIFGASILAIGVLITYFMASKSNHTESAGEIMEHQPDVIAARNKRLLYRSVVIMAGGLMLTICIGAFAGREISDALYLQLGVLIGNIFSVLGAKRDTIQPKIEANGKANGSDEKLS